MSIFTVRHNKADLKLYMNGQGLSNGGSQLRGTGGDLTYSLASPVCQYLIGFSFKDVA